MHRPHPDASEDTGYIAKNSAQVRIMIHTLIGIKLGIYFLTSHLLHSTCLCFGSFMLRNSGFSQSSEPVLFLPVKESSSFFRRGSALVFLCEHHPFSMLIRCGLGGVSLLISASPQWEVGQDLEQTLLVVCLYPFRCPLHSMPIILASNSQQKDDWWRTAFMLMKPTVPEYEAGGKFLGEG